MRSELDAFEAGTASVHRVSDVDAIGRPRRAPADLDAAILQQLAAGPLMKWQLREALHEPDAYILKRLRILKDAGQVKVSGSQTDKRGWALTRWMGPTRPTSPIVSPGRPPAPPPATSWWIGTSREEFSNAVKARSK